MRLCKPLFRVLSFVMVATCPAVATRINAVQLAFSVSPVPVREHVWIDNVVVSTERIGFNIPP